MDVLFSEDAWEEFCAIKANTPLAKAIRDTIKDIQRGNKLGKEEHLKYDMSGLLSRRLDKQNRLIYRVVGETLQIVKCTAHYNDK